MAGSGAGPAAGLRGGGKSPHRRAAREGRPLGGLPTGALGGRGRGRRGALGLCAQPPPGASAERPGSLALTRTLPAKARFPAAAARPRRLVAAASPSSLPRSALAAVASRGLARPQAELGGRRGWLRELCERPRRAPLGSGRWVPRRLHAGTRRRGEAARSPSLPLPAPAAPSPQPSRLAAPPRPLPSPSAVPVLPALPALPPPPPPRALLLLPRAPLHKCRAARGGAGPAAGAARRALPGGPGPAALSLSAVLEERGPGP